MLATVMARNKPKVDLRVNLDKLWDEDLTLKAVSEATELHENTLSQYRRGSVAQPRLDILIVLARYFSKRTGKKITVDDLFEVND